MQVVVEHGEDEPEIHRHGRLPREERLDALLDREVPRVHLVVERDDLLRELDVAVHERAECAAQRAEDEVALLLEARFELVELFLERDPHPNLPVT
jgi:hypothetical protein